MLDFALTFLQLCCSCPRYEMQDQRDHSKHEQQMDEPTRDVEHGETAEPCDQQDHKQYRPNAHHDPPGMALVRPRPHQMAIARGPVALVEPRSLHAESN